MTSPRRCRVAAAALLLAVSGALLVVAPSASAAISGFPSASYTSNTTINIQASVARSATQSVLTLTDPTGARKQLSATTSKDVLGQYSAATLSYTLSTTCEQASTNSCSGLHPAFNGSWVVKVAGDSANSDTKQFRIDIAPRIPSGVSAASTGPGQITLSWQPNAEPDLQQYDVLDGAGNQLRSIGADGCGSDTCSSVFTYAANDSGDRSFSVSATRNAPVEASGSLTSPGSSPQSATLQGPPSPSPSPAPASHPSGTAGSGQTGGGQTGGGQNPGASHNAGGGQNSSGPGASGSSNAGANSSGGSSSGSGAGVNGPFGSPAAQNGMTQGNAAAAALAARAAFAQSFSSFAPKIGLNKLPPLPVNEGPILAEGVLPDGTYNPTLGYTDKVITEKVRTGGGTTSMVTGAFSRVLDSAQLARTIAVTLLLLVTGLHLRRWAANGSR